MSSFEQGKKMRLEAEYLAAVSNQPVPKRPPKYSPDLSQQRQFGKGWRSVTPTELYKYRGQAQDKSANGIQKVKEIRSQLFQKN